MRLSASALSSAAFAVLSSATGTGPPGVDCKPLAFTSSRTISRPCRCPSARVSALLSAATFPLASPAATFDASRSTSIPSIFRPVLSATNKLTVPVRLATTALKAVTTAATSNAFTIPDPPRNDDLSPDHDLGIRSLRTNEDRPDVSQVVSPLLSREDTSFPSVRRVCCLPVRKIIRQHHAPPTDNRTIG